MKMAYIDIVVNPLTGQPVERTFIGDTGNGWSPGTPSSSVTQLPDRPVAASSGGADWMNLFTTQEILDMAPDVRMAAAGIPTPPAIPPEVADLLAPGTDPYASLQGPGASVFQPAPTIYTPPQQPSYTSPPPAGVPAATGAAGPQSQGDAVAARVDPELEGWFTGSPNTPLSPALIGEGGFYPNPIYMETSAFHEIAEIPMEDPRIRRIPYGGHSGKGF